MSTRLDPVWADLPEATSKGAHRRAGDVSPELAAWYREQEAALVERAVDLIRLSQYKYPESAGVGIEGWWSELWGRLDHLPDRRRTFLRHYRRKNRTRTIALVGCGAAKADTNGEAIPAAELYTSSYFQLKRRWGQLYADAWRVLSAEHHLVRPSTKLEPYDTEISDVEDQAWAWRVEQGLWSLLERIAADLDPRPWACANRLSLQEALDELGDLPVEFVVLAGTDYREPLQDALQYFAREFNIAYRCPFADTAGIGEQMGWLTEQLEAYPRLSGLDEGRAIRLLRPWTPVPAYIAQHASGNPLYVRREDDQEGAPWRAEVCNTPASRDRIADRLQRYQPEYVDAEAVPAIPEARVGWEQDQRRLAEWSDSI